MIHWGMRLRRMVTSLTRVRVICAAKERKRKRAKRVRQVLVIDQLLGLLLKKMGKVMRVSAAELMAHQIPPLLKVRKIYKFAVRNVYNYTLI